MGRQVAITPIEIGQTSGQQFEMQGFLTADGDPIGGECLLRGPVLVISCAATAAAKARARAAFSVALAVARISRAPPVRVGDNLTPCRSYALTGILGGLG
jgi:hypothetical protein